MHECEAMTFSQWKILGATVLAYVFTPSGMQTFGQPGGLAGSQKPAQAVPDSDEFRAAPDLPNDQTAQAVKRLADVLKRDPPKRRAAGEHRLQLYMMDLVGGG